MTITIEYLDKEEAVYDITVDVNHNFFANDVLVHNCTEITLHADEEHTYTCVLSSLNGYRYDSWKDTGAVFASLVLLDCNVEEFLERARNIKGMEKAVNFTEKSRALGLGLLGFHSYLQHHMIPIESFEAHIKNNQMFKHIHDESLEATQWMAKEWGEPEWCKGHGVRNTHRCAIAPNMSSASMAGQVSQGIEPIIANVYTQATTAGEMQRINPEFLRIAKERKKFNKAMLTSVIDKQGSVQHLDWLDENEKAVFKTAFEIDQKVLLRLASTRQQWIDQGQSLNLFFDADEDEEYIADVHKMFFEDERLKGLYYLRTLSGVDASKDTCSSCEG